MREKTLSKCVFYVCKMSHKFSPIYGSKTRWAMYPRTTFKIDLRKRAYKRKVFKRNRRKRFGQYLVPNPLFSRNLNLKILYLFPYFRTKRPALFVIYRDKNISPERRFNELSIDVSFLIFGKKMKILQSDETNHLRSERRCENYTVFCTLRYTLPMVR